MEWLDTSSTKSKSDMNWVKVLEGEDWTEVLEKKPTNGEIRYATAVRESERDKDGTTEPEPGE